jgi:hypothetical protein
METVIFRSRPSVDLPSDAFLAGANGVYVPWFEGIGRLTVSRPLLGSSATVTVNDRVVATPRKATRLYPWVECPLREADPHQLVVVQLQSAPALIGTLVFVDGICLQDGGTLDSWRARQPAPMDYFEQAIRPDDFWGAKVAILLGVGTVAFAAVGTWSPTSPIWFVALAASSAVAAGWWLVVARLVRWLRTKRTWPWRLRVLSVPAVLLGLPVLIMLTLQAFAASR